MRIAHINSVDISGGAAVASNRLHKGLRQSGIDSREIVTRKETSDPTVNGPSIFSQNFLSKVYSFLDRLPPRLYRDYNGKIFSTGYTRSNIKKRVSQLNPDIIHLHWINGGFLQIEDLKKFDTPIVWTLHDMWPFTGGCHYSGNCSRYDDKCGRCPILGSERDSDLSRRIWSKKNEAWDDIKITAIAPSEWMAESARSSSLFANHTIHQIPNGIDTSVYQPVSDSIAESLFDLPQNKKIILFGAANPDDPRKGYDYLIEALNKIGETYENVELVTFGSNPISIRKDTNQSVTHVGYVDRIGLISLYSVADTFVLPSLEDNLPNTVLESMACGTPVTAFNIGGISDMISHKVNGYLASPESVSSLCDGICWILDQGEHANIGEEARQAVCNNFELTNIATQHSSLYRKLTNKY